MKSKVSLIVFFFFCFSLFPFQHIFSFFFFINQSCGRLFCARTTTLTTTTTTNESVQLRNKKKKRNKTRNVVCGTKQAAAVERSYIKVYKRDCDRIICRVVRLNNGRKQRSEQYYFVCGKVKIINKKKKIIWVLVSVWLWFCTNKSDWRAQRKTKIKRETKKN